jgi:outer membrane protein assembly factor BamB
VSSPKSAASGEVIDLQTIRAVADVSSAAAVTDARGRAFIVGSIDKRLSDAYVLALDAKHEPLWTKHFGGRGVDEGDDVAVDATGVYVSGVFASPSIDLGGGPLANAGGRDLFLAKYDFDGKLLWAKRYGDALDQGSMRLRAHPDGGVIATGWFDGTLDFGSGPVRGVDARASYVARIDGSGRALWARAFGHRFDFAETDAVIDARGHVFVSGGSDGTSELVPGGGPRDHYDLGPVLLELDDHGVIVSTKRFGGGANNMTTALALAPDGSLRFAAATLGAVDFGDGLQPAPGHVDVHVARFDAAGTLAWRAQPFGGLLARVEALAVDARGDTIVVGEILRANASRGIAVALSPSGTIRWTYELAGGIRSSLQRVSFDARGRVVLVGMRDDAIVFVTLAP